MLIHRPYAQLPRADRGWLKASHHFRVDGLPDGVHTPLKSLYVWNDDQVAPSGGFPLHFHRDVEIFTYVRSGTVTHQDVLGNLSEVREGDIQVMTAGTGIRHSEFNCCPDPLRLFQIWFEPTRKGLNPRYATRRFAETGRSNELMVLASGLPEAARSTHLPLQARARVLGGRIEHGRRLSYPIAQGNELYLVASHGGLHVNGLRLDEGDGVAVTGEAKLLVEALADSEILIAEMV